MPKRAETPKKKSGLGFNIKKRFFLLFSVSIPVVVLTQLPT
jgi:hypothetical protein